MSNHTGWDTPTSRKFYGKPEKLIRHLRGRSKARTELDCVAADEIERLQAQVERQNDYIMTINRLSSKWKKEALKNVQP